MLICVATDLMSREVMLILGVIATVRMLVKELIRIGHFTNRLQNGTEIDKEALKHLLPQPVAIFTL